MIAERARSFYNASQEDFIDNVEQFAYYPIATLNGVDNFSNGSIRSRTQNAMSAVESTPENFCTDFGSK